MTKRQVAIVILVFVALLLYTGGSYVAITRKLAQPTPPPTGGTTPTPPQPEPTRIEITNAPFSHITKEEVEAMAEGGGVKEITLVYGPPPQEERDRILEEASKAGEAVPSFLQGPVNTGALAGYFKEMTGTTLVLTQKDRKEYTLGLTDATRLWINTGGKLEIISQFVTKLPDPAALFSPEELILATSLDEQPQPPTVQTLVVYQ